MTMLSRYLFAFMIYGALSENIHSDVLRLYADNDDNRQETRDLKQDVRNLVQEVSAMKENNENAESDIRNLVQEVSALKEKNKNAENDIRNLVREVSALKEKNNKAENEIMKLRNKLDLMEATDRTTSEPVTTRKMTTPGTNEDSLWFDGKRYIALTSSSDYVNKSTAEAKCQNICGNLTNFYNRAHMNKIINYVRQYKLDGSYSRWFHLGMTYDPINKILRLRNGTQVSINDYKWYPGYPRNGARWFSWTNMVILIGSIPSDAKQYLLNWPSDSNIYVLCEI